MCIKISRACLPVSNPSTGAPSSYSIPAGSSIALPWGSMVTAIDSVQVENGIAYTTRSPLIFVRKFGDNLAISRDPSLSQGSERMEMVGVTWQNSPIRMALIKPDGSILSAKSDSQNIKHLTGPNYDYYFLRKPASSYWRIWISPAYPSASGEGFSLISGLVEGVVPANQI